MTSPTGIPPEPDDLSPERHESRNLGILALQLIIMRIGWIFKTESVIIPHVLDIISSNASWARGFLPVLNRLGQSLPPLLAADFIRDIRLKKRALIYTTMGMALPFLTLASVWWWLEARDRLWLVVLFLILYLLFFSATGLNQLVDGTLQGKLIRPDRRGRLLGIAGVIGSIGAVCAAYFLLRPWIQLPNHDGFVYIFMFNGSAYVIAGLMANLCHEQPDESPADKPARPPFWSPFARAWQTFRDDQRFRRAAWMATLFMTGLLLFPHYQAMAREMLGTSDLDIIWWVIAQNISVGVLSPIFGGIADRWGNRIALRIAAFLAAFTPIIAVLLASPWFPLGREWFWITYVFLGLTPVTMKTISNYTLELVPRDKHPQYLSTMTICYTVPFLFSPLLGFAMDYIPFQIPFLAVSCTIAIGGLLTFRMAEPRHDA
ncbi:MAG TPA: MFS transporter [Planctomycetaceae bacterium]|nr:MFS transporter [Planctomycetaceae bacterium]